MANLNLAAHGGRFKYIVIPIKGKVKRVQYGFETKEVGKDERGNPRFQHTMVKNIVEQPGGYMVYCPMGHVVRLTERQLRRYKLNRPPGLADMRGRYGDTPAGKTFGEQAEAINRDGMVKNLELMTVHLATRKTGTRLLLKEEKIPEEFEEFAPSRLPDPRAMDYTEEATITIDK